MGESAPAGAGLSRAADRDRLLEVKGDRLVGQAAWVTGAASGMGRAVAKLFAAEGANVALIDRNQEAGALVAEEITSAGGHAHFLGCDVAVESEVADSIEAAAGRYDGLQILVNCAAIGGARLLHQMEAEEWDALMTVNVRSIFFSIKHGLTHLQRNANSYVVNIGSTSSFVAQVDTPAYTTTKGAVLLLSRSIALDYAHLGLRCNCVCPGLTDTPAISAYYSKVPGGKEILAERIRRVPLGRMILPEEVARAVLFLSCEDSSGITGTTLTVDGGYTSAAEWNTDAVTQMPPPD